MPILAECGECGRKGGYALEEDSKICARCQKLQKKEKKEEKPKENA